MFLLLQSLIQAIQPFLVPLCFIFAWTLIGLIAWSLWSAIQDGVAKAKQMHQIPCTGCQFFTNDYRLKCTVHPDIANSEQAIDCTDFTAVNNPLNVH
ncbi:hypothetical protein H6G20_18065 [Desertifilum sp. FACHB-1129]|uniref:Uncharacterized protein n=3 Tax=Cyanophyceae TaxID=3028117 RepID=A0A1E5QIT4_9CYAN|nr:MULTISPECIES: hypothetical protein [Cyanophyceae]MDA0210196.1 hypothetical protein [Cyanobacteria bacterium FC1]MDL5047267.1 hypothetical protein [Oscillatoria amoena NRMC-F 0135]MBD2313579.1 hypothetical protein [Desertifilum sp. FACHB-1129]MBD2320600.1 hypothetical protein [Desertifilum sp. FACHB-866]MBD2330728.1 hypothetical protein [Desertifilum sp. FACHB-868]